MRPAPKIRTDWILAAGILLALLGWIDDHGYFIGADAIVQEVLARSLWNHGYFLWIKREFAAPGGIIHPETGIPPLLPLLYSLAGAVGLDSWHRGTWLGIVSVAAWVPAGSWAIAPLLGEEKRKLLRPHWIGVTFTALLLALARNQLWEELYLGLGAPFAVLLLLLALGLYARSRWLACGIMLGLLGLARTDAWYWPWALILAHAALSPPKGVRHLLLLFAGYAAVSLPWWAWLAYNGACPVCPPWRELWLGGSPIATRWFPDTDSGQGHPVSAQPALVFYEMFARNRWYELVRPYFGEYLGELFTYGLIIFGGIAHALYRKRLRVFLLALLLASIGWLSWGAALADAFPRRYGILLDAGIVLWLTLLLWDPGRWVRFAAAALAGLMIFQNTAALSNDVRSLKPSVSFIEGSAPFTAFAIRELDPARDPALADTLQGLAVGYHVPELPLVELPANWQEPGILDALIDRFSIRWTTIGPQKIAPALKTHRMIERKASNGVSVWELTRL